MLPTELVGPKEAYFLREDNSFVETNSRLFPHLDPDFISQICYEHPHQLDGWLPGFNVEIHQAKRVLKSAEWIRDNVQYDRTGPVRLMWHWQVDRYLATGENGSPVLPDMIANQTWPFPPVIIETGFARELGALGAIGEPYNLVEGTHRTSYLVHLLEIGFVLPESTHEIIEILPLPRN